MTMVIEQIIQKAIELSLPDFLKWIIVSKIISKVGEKNISKVYDLIRNKYNEKKYAFFPNKEEAYTLKKLSNKSLYKDFRRVLQGHWGIDVVRTGIYILHLEHKKKPEKIKDIKEQVFRNKKLIGLRLLAMIQAGILRPVLDYLINLKDKNNYCKDDLFSEFDNILNDWKRMSIFIQNEDSLSDIIKKTKELIDNKEETIFILAKGNAMENAFNLMVQLQKDKYLIEKGYVWFANTDNETEPPTFHCSIHSSTYLM